MFGLDPLSRSVAVVEMLLLLGLAALIGWLLGRWVRNGRVHTLRAALTDKQTRLEAQRRATNISMPDTSVPATTNVNREAEMPSASVAPIVSSTPLPTPTPIETTPVVAAPEPLRPVAAHMPPPVVEPLRTPNPDPAGRVPEKPVVHRPPAGVPVPEAPVFSTPMPRPDEPDRVELSTDLPSLQPKSRPLPNSFLPGNTEAAVLNRIALRANELNFDRIGRATAAQADDLKDIAGIGPFLERKLHSLGIYTYRQIANFTKEDSEQVNEIIEFFPGRVERDNWVGQAKGFHERKYGARA